MWVGAAKIVSVVVSEVDCGRSVVNIIKAELASAGSKVGVDGVGFRETSGGVKGVRAGGVIEVCSVLEGMAWVSWVRHCGNGGAGRGRQ